MKDRVLMLCERYKPEWYDHTVILLSRWSPGCMAVISYFYSIVIIDIPKLILNYLQE